MIKFCISQTNSNEHPRLMHGSSEYTNVLALDGYESDIHGDDVDLTGCFSTPCYLEALTRPLLDTVDTEAIRDAFHEGASKEGSLRHALEAVAPLLAEINTHLIVVYRPRHSKELSGNNIHPVVAGWFLYGEGIGGDTVSRADADRDAGKQLKKLNAWRAGDRYAIEMTNGEVIPNIDSVEMVEWFLSQVDSADTEDLFKTITHQNRHKAVAITLWGMRDAGLWVTLDRLDDGRHTLAYTSERGNDVLIKIK